MSFFFSSILIITALSLSLSLFLPPRRATRSNQLTALSLASPVARLVLGYIAMCCAQQLRGQTKNKQLKTKQKQTTSIRTNTDPLRYFSVYLVAETCKKKKSRHHTSSSEQRTSTTSKTEGWDSSKTEPTMRSAFDSFKR